MKIQNCFSILSLLLVLALCFSCKDKDDDQAQDDPEVDPLESCCAIPPVEAVAGDAKVYLPNAFTPNGDGINDIFYAQGNQSFEAISINSFQIFSGMTTVFEENDFLGNNPGFGWDGRNMDGTMLPDSVYSYSLTFETATVGSLTLVGDVCLRGGSPIDCVGMEGQCAFGVQHSGEGEHDANLPTFEECN